MIIHFAFRNLKRQKKNTLFLVLLISFITFIFFIGNSILTQTDKGLKQSYVDNLTADLMVQRKSEITMNIFGANTPIIDSFFTIPTIPAYQDVRSAIIEHGGAIPVSIVSGKSVMDLLGIRVAVPLTGIEAPNYFDVFPGIKLVEGRYLEASEYGVMITSDRAKSIEIQSGKSLQIGMPIKFTNASEVTFKIREVPLVGIYTYTNPGSYMDQIVLMDPQTVRSLSSVLTVASEKVDVDNEALDLLEEDIDSIFFDSIDLQFEDESISIDDLKLDISSVQGIQSPSIGGDWNFILLRVNDGQDVFELQKKLNEILDSFDLSVVDWRTAAGTTALMILLIQNFFFIGIFLISIAGAISIVNIVLISVFRRSREIGTLRAIGASDYYISLMIIFENIIISFIAGLLGVFLGVALIKFVNGLGITINNSIISSLLGHSRIVIQFQVIEAIKATLLAIFLGFLSSIFPSWQAVKIHPIEAVRRG